MLDDKLLLSKLDESRQLRKFLSDHQKHENSSQNKRILNSAGTAGKFDIPILIPDAAKKEWIENDPNGVFVSQELNTPILANGLYYDSDFFKVFLKHLKNAPIPGSRAGHELTPGVNPPTDVILVGGDVFADRVRFLNFIPSRNETLIKEARSGMIQFSLVCYADDIRRDSKIFVGPPAAYGLRNDIVEVPAMTSKVSVA